MWTLETIRQKIRRVTGRPSVVHIADADIDAAVNNFYRNVLPIELPHLNVWQGWWTQTTSAGEDTYPVSSDYIFLATPFYIDGTPAELFTHDPEYFYNLWPQSQTWDNGLPINVLYHQRQVILRPPPDGGYLLRARAMLAPSAMVQTADAPLADNLGLLIVYGASIDILQEHGQIDEVNSLVPLYQKLVENIGRHDLLQWLNEKPVARW